MSNAYCLLANDVVRLSTEFGVKLTAKQAENLITAYVCQTANGYAHFGHYTSTDMKTLETKGLAESRLQRSVNGGNMARRYRLTDKGIKLGCKLHQVRNGGRA